MSSLSPRRRLAGFALAAATCVVLGVASGAGSAPLSVAPDGPGALSHFDLARKDCLGTARNTTSKVWFTVADGVLSDVYYPTIDNTNVETLQYVVTDGSTFTDLQTRDMTSTARGAGRQRDGLRGHEHAREREVPDRHRLRGRPGHERAPDEGRVQGRTRSDEEARRPAPLPPLRSDRERQRRRRGRERRRRLGDHGHLDRPPVLVASDPNTATNAVNRDYAQPVYAALDAPVRRGDRTASPGPPATGSRSSTPRTR